MLKLTGLWKEEKKDGSGWYLTGKLNPGLRLLIFPNTYKKEGDNQPDFQAYLAPIEKQDGQPGDSDPGFANTDEALNGRGGRPAPPPTRAAGGGPRQYGNQRPVPDDELPPPPDLDELGLKPASSIARPAPAGRAVDRLANQGGRGTPTRHVRQTPEPDASDELDDPFAD